MRPIRPTLTGAALALALTTAAGVTTTASPASADTFGRLTISARGHIVDEDSPDADDICDPSVTNDYSVRTNEDFRPASIRWQCDEVLVEMRPSGHVNDDGFTDLSFTAHYSYRECWFGSCFWALAKSSTIDTDLNPGQTRTWTMTYTNNGAMRVQLSPVSFSLDI
jgi:hypothetical protein